jgi:hypothetical protein
MKTFASALALTALCAVSWPAAAAQSLSAADFHAEVLRTYDFAPHSLTKEQRAVKSDGMDVFWKKAKEDPATYAAGLRRELANFDNPSFFFFDGGELLLSLSSTVDDQKLVLAALPHTDLRDVDSTAYLRLVNHLAAEGDDTTAAALHILDDATFQAFIPQHVLMLGQNYSLVYMLYPTDPKFWLDAAIARLGTEEDEKALKSLLLVLSYAQTDASDAAVRAFGADNTKSETSLAEAKKYLDLVKIKPAASVGDDSQTSLEALRTKRRERMKSISDEALMDFEKYTRQILAIRKSRGNQITSRTELCSQDCGR